MASTLSIPLGEYIRTLRQNFGWGQVDLAVHADTTRTHISAVERGEREICLGVLERLATALQTTPGDLLLAAQRLRDENPKK